MKSTAYYAAGVPLTEIELPQMLWLYFESIGPSEQPQFHQLWDVKGLPELVSRRFRKVPKGSLLSYQLHVVSDSPDNVIVVTDVPCPPPFTFPDLSPFAQAFLPVSDCLHNIFSSLEVSESLSREFEEATRSQYSTEDWRSSFDSLASQLLCNRTVIMSCMSFGVENELVAAEINAKDFGRNVYRVGFVIKPT